MKKINQLVVSAVVVLGLVTSTGVAGAEKPEGKGKPDKTEVIKPGKSDGIGKLENVGKPEGKGKPETNKGLEKAAEVNKGQKGKEMSRQNKVAVTLPNGKVVYKNPNAAAPKVEESTEQPVIEQPIVLPDQPTVEQPISLPEDAPTVERPIFLPQEPVSVTQLPAIGEEQEVTAEQLPVLYFSNYITPLSLLF